MEAPNVQNAIRHVYKNNQLLKHAANIFGLSSSTSKWWFQANAIVNSNNAHASKTSSP